MAEVAQGLQRLARFFFQDPIEAFGRVGRPIGLATGAGDQQFEDMLSTFVDSVPHRFKPAVSRTETWCMVAFPAPSKKYERLALSFNRESCAIFYFGTILMDADIARKRSWIIAVCRAIAEGHSKAAVRPGGGGLVSVDLRPFGFDETLVAERSSLPILKDWPAVERFYPAWSELA